MTLYSYRVPTDGKQVFKNITAGETGNSIILENTGETKRILSYLGKDLVNYTLFPWIRHTISFKCVFLPFFQTVGINHRPILWHKHIYCDFQALC